MSKPIGEVIFNFKEKQEDYGQARKDLIEKAEEMGADPKFINGDHRIAMSYLMGYKRGHCNDQF